jgi:hypothetical protein
MSADYADPSNPDRPKSVSEPLAKLFGGGRYPLEQRIEDKKRGIGRQRYPFVGKSVSQAVSMFLGI